MSLERREHMCVEVRRVCLVEGIKGGKGGRGRKAHCTSEGWPSVLLLLHAGLEVQVETIVYAERLTISEENSSGVA